MTVFVRRFNITLWHEYLLPTTKRDPRVLGRWQPISGSDCTPSERTLTVRTRLNYSFANMAFLSTKMNGR